MPRASAAEYLVVGCLAVAVAVVSVAIVELTGEWPTDFGVWGAILFSLLGSVLLWKYVERRSGGRSRE